MRIYLKLTKNNKVVPFDYQHLLTGCIHKWLGYNNTIHGTPGRFSFSWIQNTQSTEGGLDMKFGAYFFISSIDDLIIRNITKGILKDPHMFCGIRVKDVQIAFHPEFTTPTKFVLASPVLLKVKEENGYKHVTVEDDDFEIVLTENLRRKLKVAGISSENIQVKLDPESHYKKTKMVSYKGIKNKTSFTPIIIEGSPEQIAFAWNVGIGNSTGIGFGALK